MSLVFEADRLSKRYGSVRVLNELSLSVRAGEIYGLLGRNGAGKSTTLRIAMGISKPSDGDVRLFGESVRARRHLRMRQKVGYVAQEQHFYPWMHARSLGDFVGSFYESWDRNLFAHLIERLDIPWSRRVSQLSGGMRVKLALALALAHRPALLILDEPTAGLDPVARREFLELVRDQADRNEVTTLFSTHLVDEVELAADRVGIVEAGRTRFEGSVPELSDPFLWVVQQEPGECDLPLALASADFEILDEQRRTDGRRLWVRRSSLDAERRLRESLAAEDSGWTVRDPSLEDVFVQLVRRSI